MISYKNMDTTEVAAYVQELSSQNAQEIMAEKSGAVRAELVTSLAGQICTENAGQRRIYSWNVIFFI